MKKLASAMDPLWYKDAVIYELHIRAFQDSNGDGIGDLQGLISRLDYLQDLGVTCIWMLPFFPSPLRDDGYDIANYCEVHPSYGTLDDFRQFLDAAHRRNMQVMIELVINHTSDRHPWFQRARHASKNSSERNYYVWSDTPDRYKDARIIFTDTEKSNWTWDDTAQAYYWHRFFSHQPDLNFDHPAVMEEVLTAMRFWLDMGVDAMRMDAIPYLVERDGTSCENLPETHLAIKKIRAAIDSEYANRLVLAEANQWPADVLPYFGDGDECHMAFHFPLMPRIYMALRQEDRLPITDIMAQTPEIPPACQWGLFLRNHDELTLEMVTSDERDYMYFAYSADPRMRVNVGIRRRLAPLVDNNRRRIELLNSLLLSFPGTPILYYGDEIGMGDNIYLGDRNGVRTPMQWNSDRNAGFSKAVPAKLYFPVIMDPIWGYQAINVEAQQSDPSSLLHWTRNMIALRKLFKVFGRGTLEFLSPENRKILAYIRRYDPDAADSSVTASMPPKSSSNVETVLCVANLSRFAQPVSLDLSQFSGMVPIEMLGYVTFPSITMQPYPLTLAPYSFLWFELQPAQARSEAPERELSDPALDLLLNQAATAAPEQSPQLDQPAEPEHIANPTVGPEPPTVLIDEHAPPRPLDPVAEPTRMPLPELPPATATPPLFLLLQQPDVISTLIAAYLPHQRWFGAKSRTISKVHIASSIFLNTTVLVLLDVSFTDGSQETYQLPLAVASEGDAEEIERNSPGAVIATSRNSFGFSMLYDATAGEPFRKALIHHITHADPWTETIKAGASTKPSIELLRSRAFDGIAAEAVNFSRLGSAEQSNTTIFYGNHYFLKLFRRLQPGENPDVEISRFLTERSSFTRIPTYFGELRSTGKGITTLGMLQATVENEGDGWEWAMSELQRFYESVEHCPPPSSIGQPAGFLQDAPFPPSLAHEIEEHAGFVLQTAALLGHRTAEMHLALATPTEDPAFQAELATADDIANDADRIYVQLHAIFITLERMGSKLPASAQANAFLERRDNLLQRIKSLRDLGSAAADLGQRIRIHGDLHLGQTLLSHNDFIFLDFEGEPARSLEERRRKQSPLRDVAGMLRSFSYAAHAALDHFSQRRPESAKTLEPWANLWQNAVSTQFLSAWRTTIAAAPQLLPQDPQKAQLLLDAYTLGKALYELLYELNNRLDWIRIPMAGILALPDTPVTVAPGTDETCPL